MAEPWYKKFRSDFSKADKEWQEEWSELGYEMNIGRRVDPEAYDEDLESGDRDYMDSKNRLLAEFDAVYKAVPQKVTGMEDLKKMRDLKDKAESFMPRWKALSRNRKPYAEQGPLADEDVSRVLKESRTHSGSGNISTEEGQRQPVTEMATGLQKFFEDYPDMKEIRGEDLHGYVPDEYNTVDNFRKAMEILRGR